MNDLHVHALEESKNIGKRFVIYKSLHEMRVGEDSIYEHLKDGYEIRSVCVNGEMHNIWKIEDKNIIRSLEHILEMKLECNFLFVKTQEFFDALYKSEGVKMWIELWKNEQKPEIIILHERDDKTKAKIKKILDIIFIRNLKQYKDDILRFYERKSL